MHPPSSLSPTPPRLSHTELFTALGIRFDPTLRRTRKNTATPALSTPSATSTALPDNVISMGGRNNALASIAGSMRASGADEDAILKALLEENAQNVHPPLADAEVGAIAHSISAYTPSPAASPQARSLNDTGNAARLVDQHADILRYVGGREEWLMWDDNRWNIDCAAQITELAKHVGKAIYLEAARCTDSDLRKKIAGHAGRSLNEPKIKAMIALAQSDPRVRIESDELDKHDRLLAVANGVIDLTTGRLRASRPEDLITRCSPVMFDPKAKCPTFHRFINQVTATTKRDKQLVRYLQRVAGYTLSGLTDEHVLFFLYGSGANGKSTFLKIMQELMGSELTRKLPYGSIVASKHARGASNDVARLAGVRFVVASEVEEGTFLDEALVKDLTGGDIISARMLYKEFFDFTPNFKIMLAGNHKPVIKNNDEGMWRRIHQIPFTVTIPQDQRDPRLMDKLRAELPGILNWALKGYRLWQSKRLSPPTCITGAVQEYREEMDLLGHWIAERCKVGPYHSIRAQKAYDNYRGWAITGGFTSWNIATFGRKLSERFQKKKTNTGVVYEGLDQDEAKLRW